MIQLGIRYSREKSKVKRFRETLPGTKAMPQCTMAGRRAVALTGQNIKCCVLMRIPRSLLLKRPSAFDQRMGRDRPFHENEQGSN
jgi:hypothetical protein